MLKGKLCSHFSSPMDIERGVLNTGVYWGKTGGPVGGGGREG